MKIIQNAIKTPDGTFLRSYHVHDFVEYEDDNGQVYMVDGGNQYIRRSAWGDEEDLTKYYEECDFFERRKLMTWGTFGKNQDKQLHFKPICKMSNEHIENVLSNVTRIATHFKEMFHEELEYRKENNILIED